MTSDVEQALHHQTLASRRFLQTTWWQILLLWAFVCGPALEAHAEPGSTSAQGSHWLQDTPPGVKPFEVEFRDGSPVLHDLDTANRYFSLLALAVEPTLLEPNECRLLPGLWDAKILSPFVHVGKGCYGKFLGWKGSDEFERVDLRTKFMSTHAKALLDWLPKLPQPVALIDDVALGEYDTATSAFPLIALPAPALLGALTDNFSGANLVVSERFSWPQPRLPTADMAAARALLGEIKSWSATSSSGKPRPNDQRLMRRMTVIKIVGLDLPNRLAEIELLTMGLFNFDLSREYYRFPIEQFGAPFSQVALPPRLEVQTPAPLDPLHLYIRLVAATSGRVDEPIWDSLRLLLATRDEGFYANSAGAKPLSEHDARRPFFPPNHYVLTEEQRPTLLKWTAAYTAGMPTEVEYVRDYTNNEFVPDRVYSFPAVPDLATVELIDVGLQAGFARERILAIRGVQNVLLIVPSAAATYAMQAGDKQLQPFAGKKLMIKTRLSVKDEKTVSHPQFGEVLMLQLKPLSVSLQHEGNEIGSTLFE